MTRKLFISASFILFITVSFAQGLNWNPAAFEAREKIDVERGPDELPASASLKAHTPYTFLQHGSTCVAYSVASARTILWAKNNNITDKQVITANAYSPWWIYYRNKYAEDVDCSMGLDPEIAITDILSNGIPKLFDVEYADYWPFTESILTNYYPPSYSDDVVDAGKWKLDAAYRLETLGDIKVALTLDMPVIVGMYPSDSFNNVMGADKWSPAATEEPVAANGHAMVIVGYDDNKYGGAVEILNSWSDQWGSGGYVWVTYDDFLRFTAGAYGLERNSDAHFSAGNELFSTDDTNTMEVKDGEPVWMSTSDFEFKAKPKDAVKNWSGVDASLKQD